MDPDGKINGIHADPDPQHWSVFTPINKLRLCSTATDPKLVVVVAISAAGWVVGWRGGHVAVVALGGGGVVAVACRGGENVAETGDAVVAGVLLHGLNHHTSFRRRRRRRSEMLKKKRNTNLLSVLWIRIQVWSAFRIRIRIHTIKNRKRDRLTDVTKIERLNSELYLSNTYPLFNF